MERNIPPEHSSDVDAPNYPPSPPDSAETLLACDPWKEESRLLGVQVDALVLQFLNYFYLPALIPIPSPPGCPRCARLGWCERAMSDTSLGGSTPPVEGHQPRSKAGFCFTLPER